MAVAPAPFHGRNDWSHGQSDWSYGQSEWSYGRSDWDSPCLPDSHSDIAPDELRAVTDRQPEPDLTINTTLSDQLTSRSKNSISSEHSPPTKIAWSDEEQTKTVRRNAAGKKQCCRCCEPFRWECFGVGVVLCLLVVGAVLGSVLGTQLNKGGQQNPTDTTVLNAIMATNSSLLITVTVTTMTATSTTSFLGSPSSITTSIATVTTTTVATYASTISTSSTISSTSMVIATTAAATTSISSATSSTSTLSSIISTTTGLMTTSTPSTTTGLTTTSTITITASTSSTISRSANTATTTTTSATSTATTTAAPILICSSYYYNTSLLLNIVNPSSTTYPNYVRYSYSWTAIRTSATLALYTRQDPWGWDIDDFSVLYNGSTQLLINGGFENGDLTGWNYTSGSGNCNGDNSYVAQGNSYAHTGSYYYYGRCNGACDIIRQTFPTTVGGTYNISFWLVNYGCCSTTEIVALTIT